MTTQTIDTGFKAIWLVEALKGLAALLVNPLANWVEREREKKLILASAKPEKAYTDFSGYKESSIESRSIVDSRGRVLAQVKLWIYLDTRQCFREVTFLNALLRSSVGLSRLSFTPLPIGRGDTPAALMEVSVREFEGWLRNRTPGTQFGIESARAAAAKPVEIKVALMPPPVAQPVPAPQLAVAAAPAVTKAPDRAEPASPVRPAPAKTNLKANVEEITRGILVDFGLQWRSLPNRRFEQFCVDLTLTEQPNRGAPHRLWGADLERVIAEARAKRGDTVEVQYHGSLPVEGQGASHKKCFSMLVMP